MSAADIVFARLPEHAPERRRPTDTIAAAVRKTRDLGTTAASQHPSRSLAAETLPTTPHGEPVEKPARKVDAVPHSASTPGRADTVGGAQ